jgi:hypothetical protein
MSALVFTKDNNKYSLSKNPKGLECDYTEGEHALIIYLKEPKNLFFKYKKGIVAVPYYMVENVIYNDDHGEKLFRFIWNKKYGEILDPPPTPPPEYDIPSRDNRVFGQQIYNEFPLGSYA